jgi:alkaline phosphatase D
MHVRAKQATTFPKRKSLRRAPAQALSDRIIDFFLCDHEILARRPRFPGNSPLLDGVFLTRAYFRLHISRLCFCEDSCLMCALRFDVPGRGWNRRGFLQAASTAALAWPVLGGARSALAKVGVRSQDYPFSLGVASGDPAPDGFVIWTRLAPKPLEGGGMPAENVQVKWEVAHDEQFSKLAANGTAVATPDLAHSVHVELPGLDPNRWYFYRFQAMGEVSPIGRARTAPQLGVVLPQLKFAFASCQSYEQGLYTAYRHMAAEGLDLVAHLGDYIYEYEGREGKVRKHVGPLIHELADYRNRHAQYKTDLDLQAAHAMCPWIVTWDDHEVANNYADGTPDRKVETLEGLMTKRANGYQAYYEHMPLRAAQIPQGPNCRLYRGIQFGGLADFAVLDTRQYRTDQPCGDGTKRPCDATFDKAGTLMGDEQEQWLYERWKNSPAAWNVLTQQVMVGRVDRRPGDEEAYSMDQWPGYDANRLRLLNYFAERPSLNPVVITGDIHSNWVNNLQVNEKDENAQVVATEFVGTSISSGGDGSEEAKNTEAMYAENPFVKFFNGQRGYVSCEVTPERWQSHYRTVPYVTKPDAPLVTRASFVVERDRPGAQRVS